MLRALWNGSNQLGDFVALITSYIVVKALDLNGAVALLIIGIMLACIIIVDIIILPKDNINT
jgi:hypothetical protein